MGTTVAAQTTNPRPKFADFPAGKIYRGTPVAPQLSGEQLTFQTMIRRGARAKVEFGGHFTIPIWGCGTSCSEFVIVDSVSGKTYNGFLVVELPGAWEETQNGNLPERMEYHSNSRLLKINGCPEERDCGFYDYLIVEGKGLELLRKELLPKEFQY